MHGLDSQAVMELCELKVRITARGASDAIGMSPRVATTLLAKLRDQGYLEVVAVLQTGRMRENVYAAGPAFGMSIQERRDHGFKVGYTKPQVDKDLIRSLLPPDAIKRGSAGQRITVPPNKKRERLPTRQILTARKR